MQQRHELSRFVVRDFDRATITLLIDKHKLGYNINLSELVTMPSLSRIDFSSDDSTILCGFPITITCAIGEK